MGSHQIIADLVTRAGNGDRQAWDALVERYAPLIWSICREYRLDRAGADDVGQSVWLHLADQLGRIGDPAALAGWVATTTRRECGRVLRATRGQDVAFDAGDIPDEQVRTPDRQLLAAELREAFLHLPPCCGQLLALLVEDPPVPYAEISAKLGIPAGSIGPIRRRYLDQLRRSPAIAAFINAAADTAPTSSATS